MLKISDRAVTKALALARRDGKEPMLRIGVQGGGCAGFSYSLDFVDQQWPADTVIERGELRVLCDPKSLEILGDTEIDYDTNLLNGGFRFNNPRAKKTCSCGESFSV